MRGQPQHSDTSEMHAGNLDLSAGTCWLGWGQRLQRRCLGGLRSSGWLADVSMLEKHSSGIGAGRIYEQDCGDQARWSILFGLHP